MSLNGNSIHIDLHETLRPKAHLNPRESGTGVSNRKPEPLNPKP